MKYKETVCAVVVTYNRKELLLECLEALRKQTRPVQGIYLIDNASTDGTPKLLLKKGYIKELPPENLTEPWEKEFEVKNLTDGQVIKFHYVRMHENTGGAGGFHEGVKRAYKKGYDWLWLMDDDVLPDSECLWTLLSSRGKSKVLVPLRISKNAEIREFASIKYNLSNPFLLEIREISIFSNYRKVTDIPQVLEIQDFSFEGPLFHKDIIRRVGFPRRELFIYGDDTDYALRIRYYLKEKILLIRDARMVRQLETQKNNEVSWKTYFFWRNYFYFHKTYGENIFVRLKPFILTLGIILKSVLNVKPNLKKVKIAIMALFDCYTNNFNLRYKPGEKL